MKKSRLGRLMHYTKGFRLPIIFSFVLLAVELFLSFISPLFVSVTIDSVLTSKPVNVRWYFLWFIKAVGGIDVIKRHLWIMTLGIMGIQVLMGLVRFARARMSNGAGEGAVKRLRDRLYSHIQNLPFFWHASVQTGDIIQRATNDVDVVRRFISNDLLELVRTILMVIIGTAVMYTINVQLATITAIMVVPVATVSVLFSRRIDKLTQVQEEAEGKLFTVMQENLTGVRVVRAFGREKFEMDKFDVKNEGNCKKLIKLNRTFAMLWSTLDMLCGIETALIMVVGIILVVHGELTVGQFTAFSSYVFLFFWPIRGFGRVLSQFSRSLVAVGRIDEIFSVEEEAGLDSGETPELSGDIEFKNVFFKYDSMLVLNNLNISIRGGSTAAILGGTGSGKSTITLLLQRLYEPDSGKITIGGNDISKMNKKYLREHIGIVMQEPFLYSKTVLENISIRREHISRREAEMAAKAAAIHNDIMEFDDGYDTVVGERGVTLSGGQKQRIAIARALTGDSNLLILDDSLSAVDTQTDAEIRQSLKERCRNVTTIIISHRITTLMEADRIFVIKDGTVAEEGTHEELMRKNGIYRRTYDIQSAVEGGEAE